MWAKVEARLVEDWRQAYRWLSVWLAALIVALSEAQDQLPILREYLPADWVKWAAIAVVLARIIRQGEKP